MYLDLMVKTTNNTKSIKVGPQGFEPRTNRL